MSNRIISNDIVTVFSYRRGKQRAECSCGFEGKLRWLRGHAVVDALLHAYDTGCREDWPLVHDHRGPLPVSARRRSPWWMWTGAAGAIIGGSLYFSVPANADPADDYAAINYTVICDTIAQRPYVSTVETLVAAVMRDTGEDGEFAGSAIGVAVRDYCPWNRGTVERFIAKWLPAAPITAPDGAMGGRI